MNQLVPLAAHAPALIAAAGARASYRFFEFFTAQIRNPNTRRAYARAAVEFFDWLAARGGTQITAIESVHVAAYIEQLQKARSAPTAKLRLAALRHLIDWMVIGQIMPTNPAAAVRGPRQIVRRGKTMRVEDVSPQNRRLWVRLHEKGGKQHAMPCHTISKPTCMNILPARASRTDLSPENSSGIG